VGGERGAVTDRRGVPHTHSVYVPGCFRCDLGRDEAIRAMEDLEDLVTDLTVERDMYAARLKEVEAEREALIEALRKIANYGNGGWREAMGDYDFEKDARAIARQALSQLQGDKL
jgi:hypothetical protein